MALEGKNVNLASAIVRLLGFRPLAVDEIVGLGSVNHVFVVDTSHGRLVVRFGRDPLSAEGFAKEAYCLRLAAAHGIPSPEVVAEGEADAVGYLVQTYVDGANGEGQRSLDLWRQLGAYAKRIHSVPLDDSAPRELFPRFGRDPEENWRRHVAYNLAELSPQDPLVKLGVYGIEQQTAIGEKFNSLRSHPFQFGLLHGDLSPRNTILPPSGPPVLLDWGSATVGIAPHTELQGLIAEHEERGDPALSELGAFADGLEVDLDAMLPVLHDLVLLHHLDLIRWAIDRRPDRLDQVAAQARNTVQRCLRRSYRDRDL